MLKTNYIRTSAELDTFISESKEHSLNPKSYPCKKGECKKSGDRAEFYLFRGVSQHSYDLESSLVRHVKSARAAHGLDWRTIIQETERKLLDRFIKEIVPSVHFKDQYSWWEKAIKEIGSDTYRIMSIMQHYSAPTRLVDFTSDLWTALFFATRSPKPDTNFAIYRFSAVNEDHNDENGNKSPKGSNGRSFKGDGETQFNANTLLGRITSFAEPYSKAPINLDADPLWKDPKQSIGWDKPECGNPRLTRQDGYFIYNIDCRKTLHEDALQTHLFEKHI